MLEGLVGCFSAILTFAATSPCAEHGHHIVTNFYFARCAGKIPPTFLSPCQLHVPDVPQTCAWVCSRHFYCNSSSTSSTVKPAISEMASAEKPLAFIL